MMLEVNRIRIFYEVIGKGHPLILVHGNGEDHTIFDVLVDRLKNHFTCYVIDSRNHGKSDKTHDIHYDDMAEDMVQFIQKLHLDQPYYLGFSDGGNVGIVMALKNSHLCQKMMILGANINPKGVKMIYQKEMIEAYRLTQDPLLGLMIHEPQIPWKKLNHIETPTLIVVGEYDDITLRHSKAIVSHLKHGELLVMKEKNHYDYIVHSDDLYKICLDYLT